MNSVTLLLACVSLFYTSIAAQGFTSYANDFFDPSIVVQQSATNSTRVLAQDTIIQWAEDLSAQGPWCEYLFERRGAFAEFHLISSPTFASYPASSCSGREQTLLSTVWG